MDEIVTVVQYIFLTVNNRKTRVVIGIQDAHTPIVYTMDKGDPLSYVLYTGCMTEQEGLEILLAAEGDNFAKASRLFHKYFRGEDSEKVYVEEEEWRPISEEIHDDWFDECESIMDLMCTNARGVFVYERKPGDWY